LGVGVLVEEAKADDKEGHEPMGQAGAAALVVPGLAEDFLNGLPGDDTFQGTQPLVGGQVGQGSQVLSGVSHRGLLLGVGSQQPPLGRRLPACPHAARTNSIVTTSYVAMSGIGPRPNTAHSHISSYDDAFPEGFGARRIAMVWPFLLPVAHLAFDDARIDA